MSDSSLITSEMFNENDQTIVEQSTANLHVHARCTHEPFYWVSTINLKQTQEDTASPVTSAWEKCIQLVVNGSRAHK
jgi:hypothetical protein